MIYSIIPTRIGVAIRYFAYKPLFNKTSDKFYIGSGVTIMGSKNIEIRNEARIDKHSYLYTLDKEKSKIGNNFNLGANFSLVASFGKLLYEIIVEGDVWIASNCVITPSIKLSKG